MKTTRHFDHILLNVSDKSCTGNQIHILCSVTFYFENRAVFYIMFQFIFVLFYVFFLCGFFFVVLCAVCV
jgi:hypothetical protein